MTRLNAVLKLLSNELLSDSDNTASDTPSQRAFGQVHASLRQVGERHHTGDVL